MKTSQIRSALQAHDPKHGTGQRPDLFYSGNVMVQFIREVGEEVLAKKSPKALANRYIKWYGRNYVVNIVEE